MCRIVLSCLSTSLYQCTVTTANSLRFASLVTAQIQPRAPAQTMVMIRCWAIFARDRQTQAQQKSAAILQQQELSLGPKVLGMVFDRAAVGNAPGMKASKFACDSLVLTKNGWKSWAGCLNAFLSNVPIG